MNYQLKIRRSVLILVILGLIMPIYSFGQVSPEIKLPGNFGEIKDAGLRALGSLPELLRGVWDGFSGFCLNIWNFFKNIWNSYIFPYVANLWQQTLGKAIKERTPIIKEEYKKEKEQVKEEIKIKLPPTLKSFWERFKELIK